MAERAPRHVDAQERHFSLLLALLSTRIGFTKGELFERVEGYRGERPGDALERKFERDKEQLRELGVVIDVVVPPGDDAHHDVRYRVLDGAMGNPAELHFDAEERELLDLALRVWAEGGLTEEAQRAALKLRADPAFHSGPPSLLDARQRSHESAFLALKRAADKGRLVEFDYLKPGESSPRRRKVEPWATVLFRGRWMLVGRDRVAGEPRTFLMRRIVGKVVDRAAPAPFDVPERAAERALEELERIWCSATVTVVAAPGSDAEIRLLHRQGTEVHDDRLVIHHADRHVLADELAGFGPDVVVESPEMRALVVERLERLAALHAGGDA